MKKVLLLVLTAFMITVFPSKAYAEMMEFKSDDGKLISWCMQGKDGIEMRQGGDIIGNLPPIEVYNEKWKRMDGVLEFPNYDNMRLGKWDLEFVFTPNDKDYQQLRGYYTVNVFVPEPEESDEPTTPSLTASTVLLTNATTYDINLNDKIPGSTYKWTSSDTKVAKVNSKNGLVTAVSEGTATITCEITPPDGEIIKLQSVVTIGYDDNAPNLSDTSLDLGIGDKYTIKAENTLAKSNIRFASSDKSVVKVGTANGKVTAVSAGEAYITCTITAGGQVIVLRCDVSVTE
ncbi:hypothetical protein HNQ56_003731 [Anaerotaenia torta]|uniref:Ig-like domain-containing protein n=1 Tax=Anaerotaenia torta TaxID=433293 RepID=UPI003D1C35E1